MNPSSSFNFKEEAARQALEYVQDGMILGLGTGSTTAYFIDLLGRRLQAGELARIVGVPTSEGTFRRARAAGIPLATLEEHSHLDLVVDGADEVDPELNLIKGLGRALLREKIVETQARHFLVIVDESKVVSRLGRGPLPVEIVPFGAGIHVRWLQGVCDEAELWCEEDGSPIVTDNGNYLALCRFAAGIADPHALARILADRPGIVEHGLFLGMANTVVVAGAGGTRTMTPASRP